MSKFAIHFEEIQRRDHRNIEEQNKVFGSSKIVINYLIITLTRSIIAIFIIKNAIGKKIWQGWGCYYVLFEKKILKLFVHCHIFAQSGHQ